ncbi:Good for full DBP5 activity protein 2 [Bienertia sinuspersici]
MCYKAEFPLASLEELARARRFVFRPPPLLVGPTVNRAEARASERGERRKVCLCSPTRHPGSFRCRYHHAEYVWCSMKLSPRFQF